MVGTIYQCMGHYSGGRLMRTLHLTHDEFDTLYDVILESYQHVKHEKVETESDENLYKIYQKLIHIKGDN